MIYASVASIFFDATAYLFIIQNINTWPVGNLFIIVQFAILFFSLSRYINILFLDCFFYGCVVFSLANYFFLQNAYIFNSYTAYVIGIFMITSALSLLYRLMVELPVERIDRLPEFWIAFAVLVYYGGTLFLFLFNNYLIDHLPKSHQAIWTLHNLLNVTKNVFLFAAIWTQCKNRTSPSS